MSKRTRRHHTADPRRGASREQEPEARIAQLEAKLAKKDAVIAEISEEYVQLKKELGEPCPSASPAIYYFCVRKAMR
jgi:hypothetical protein